MISDEKIKQESDKIIAEYGCFTNDAIQDFARAIYEQGRADQREADARLFPADSARGRFCIAAIRANTGDITPCPT